MNPFVVLGVPYDATEDAIKLAYRKLAMENHPDRNPGDKSAEDRIKEINAAYDELRDDTKRAAAAARFQPRSQRTNQRAHPGFNNTHFDFDEWFRRASQQARRNNDIHVNYTISLEDAFKGKDVSLTLQGVDGPKVVTLTITPGIDNGMRIRVPGSGESHVTGSPPGDLYLTISVLPHARFVRAAQNLHCRAEIPVLTALVGGNLEFDGIDGERISVVIPAGTQPNQKFRVTGYGMPIINGAHIRGDLIVECGVRMPILTDDQKVALTDILSSP